MQTIAFRSPESGQHASPRLRASKVVSSPHDRSNLQTTLPVHFIRPNPQQARKQFDAAGIDSLAQSMRENGTLQPIVVREIDGGYELVAGERRLRAAKLAGMTEIPAIVRDTPDDRMLELALVENLQRENLNPLEKACAYGALHDEQSLTHEEIARRMGEDRRSVTNTIRLLELGEQVQAFLESGALATAHGKALLAVADAAAQLGLARDAAEKHWSVRYLEARISAWRTQRSARSAADSSDLKNLQTLLAAELKVKITARSHPRTHGGSVRFAFRNQDEKNRVTSWLRTALEAVK